MRKSLFCLFAATFAANAVTLYDNGGFVNATNASSQPSSLVYTPAIVLGFQADAGSNHVPADDFAAGNWTVESLSSFLSAQRHRIHLHGRQFRGSHRG